jgi:hypothetical protein
VKTKRPSNGGFFEEIKERERLNRLALAETSKLEYQKMVGSIRSRHAMKILAAHRFSSEFIFQVIH